MRMVNAFPTLSKYSVIHHLAPIENFYPREWFPFLVWRSGKKKRLNFNKRSKIASRRQNLETDLILEGKVIELEMKLRKAESSIDLMINSSVKPFLFDAPSSFKSSKWKGVARLNGFLSEHGTTRRSLETFLHHTHNRFMGFLINYLFVFLIFLLNVSR